MEMEDLIPGLPDEVARQCLVRFGFDQFPTVRSVSRLWRQEVDSTDYHRLRRLAGLTRPVLALAQAEPPIYSSGPAHKYSSAASSGPSNYYRLVLFDPITAMWASLPPIPGSNGGIPLFCQLAVAGHSLVVVGGWDPDTWAPTDSIHVYDLVSGTWRSGASMPGPKRSFFACAAVSGVVFVAGGHDEEKNALKSALAYDVEADRWVQLPDMANERDEPRGVCMNGAFHVISGYATEAQGRFAGSTQAFDPSTWTWGPVVEGLLQDGTCPRTCTAANGQIYMIMDGHVVVNEGTTWRNVAAVPEDARTGVVVTAIGDGRVVVVGSECHGGEQVAYAYEEKATQQVTWTRAAALPEFSGHVQSACCIEI